jgi:hypothetical protein
VSRRLRASPIAIAAGADPPGLAAGLLLGESEQAVEHREIIVERLDLQAVCLREAIRVIGGLLELRGMEAVEQGLGGSPATGAGSDRRRPLAPPRGSPDGDDPEEGPNGRSP